MIKCIKNLLFGEQKQTRNDHINNTKARAIKVEKELNRLAQVYSPPNHCCPSCASFEFRELSEQQERRLKWLSIMLKKRGLDEDIKFAKLIDEEFWP